MKLCFLIFTLCLGGTSLKAFATPEVRLLQSEFQSSEEAGRTLRQTALQLEAKGDRKAQFAHIYSLTILATAGQLARGAFENPRWVESLVVNYANLYRHTLFLELQGHRAQLPEAWRYEFSFVDSERWQATFDLIYGIKVHITRDLVEALYMTPTDFNNDSLRRDFFRITEVLKYSMPEIWKVYLRYSRSMPLITSLTQPALTDWIARLRARVWTDAQASYLLPPAQKIDFLTQLDQESAQARYYGLLLIFE